MNSVKLHSIPYERLQAIKCKEASKNPSTGNDLIISSGHYAINRVYVPRVARINSAPKASNKSKPLEVSSKAPIYLKRDVNLPKKRCEARDPRFSELSGKLNVDLFSKSFGFLDSLVNVEKEVLEKKITEADSPARIGSLKRNLSQNVSIWKEIQAISFHREKLAKRLELKQAYIAKEKAKLANEGKMPFFPNKGLLKKMFCLQKFNEMQSNGKMEKHLSKKRKKHMIRERVFLPRKRQVDSECPNERRDSECPNEF